MKKMKIMVGIPVLDTVNWQFFLHTGALLGKLAKKYDLCFCCVNRTAIDRARQTTVEDAIARNCDRLLFIDDDTLVPLDVVEVLNPLLEDKKAISASGFCYQRGYRYMPMVYRYEDLEWGKGESCQLLEPFPTEPFQVSANGMGICLLKVSLLKELGKKLGDCFGRDNAGTEDFYFYSKACQLGYTSWVNPKCEATHLGDPQRINSSTVNELRKRDHDLIFLSNEDGGRAKMGVVEA